ncbi:MAG: S9 family peptidase [Anaerolineales bacterium]
MIDLERILAIPFIDSGHPPAVSPDGELIAFSSNLSGQWEIYLLSLKEPSQVQKISQGEGAKFAPAWSPDGKWLYCVVDQDGSERFDIMRWSIISQEWQNLTPNTPDSIEAEFDLSPDGEQIALISNRSGKFEVYLLRIENLEWRKISQLPFPACDVAWSPDGKYLAITVLAKGQDYYTYIYPLDGNEPFPVADHKGQICAKQVSWSPDSSMFVFASDYKGYFNIGLYDMNLKRFAWLTSGKGDKEAPVWSPDSQKIAFLLGSGAKNSLAVINLKLRETAVCQHDFGIYHQPAFSRDSKSVFFIFENPKTPPNLFQLDLPDGKPIPLTTSPNMEEFQNYFVMPKEITYRSTDGKDVPALLYQPQQTKPHGPAVVYIHGGPNWLSQINWDGLIQHMVSRGWVVIAPNYRGSTGYGKEWQLLDRFDLGGAEAEDILAAADYLVQKRLAHAQKIAVTGRSHGGYLTMVCLTRFPDRWICGSAVVPFLNWFTAHENSRQDLQHWDLENFGDPVVDKARYFERSPFFFLDKIQAGVQMICGENDPRCPAQESILADQRLKELGKFSELHLYKGEGHFFLKLENVIDAKKKQIDFLARFLDKS